MRADRLALFIATALGVGKFPAAPGTFGSLFAVFLAFGFYQLSEHWWMIAIPVAIVLGFWSSPRACRAIGKHDASAVVIDEVAGQWLALIAIPFHWISWGLAFGLFRLFDVWKPWPISRAEKVPGASGIMLDDLLAGAFAWLIVHALLRWVI